MKSSGGSFGRIGMHVGADWWTLLNTYDDYSPILDIEVGSTTVAFLIADPEFGDSALEFARDLARQAAGFAAEVERLHARHHNGSGTAAGSGSAGEGAAA
jgi:hypothetical protein